jgi:hypothetical protein
MMNQSELNNHQGMLVTMMGISPQFSVDFNRWYDQEHMGERAAIPGFINAARYEVVRGFPQYFCLYRTRSLHVFNSEEYRRAFQHQTPWSVTNLGRMQDCARRVCGIISQTGAGTAGWLAVLPLGRLADDRDMALMAESGKAAQAMDGVIATRLLVPSPELSTPLPTEETRNRLLDPILLIEATSEPVAAAAGELARAKVEADIKNLSVYRLMWQLRKEDISDMEALRRG